jgi:uncharacterized membrane-anchored protein YhcB (DUF1043 family)
MLPTPDNEGDLNNAETPDEIPEVAPVANRPHIASRWIAAMRSAPRWALIALPSALVLGIVIGLVVTLFTPVSTDSPSFASMQHSLSSKNAKLDHKVVTEADSVATKQQTIAHLKSAAKAASQALTDRAAALDQREAAVKTREDAVTAQEKVIAANTFQGDGVYIVNRDIQPGQYRSAGGAECYWERQNAAGGILDNYLGAGPAVVTVRSTDATLTVSNCAPFTKVG